MLKLTANEAVPGCVFALVLVYAISAEWLGSVAGITGSYLLGYVFAGSRYKAQVERSFHALGHGLLIPLFSSPSASPATTARSPATGA